MADDWQPGDLAILVTEGTIRCPNCGRRQTGEYNPPHGAVREVSGIGFCTDDYSPEEVARHGHCYLPDLHFPDGTSGHSSRFRKIRPHTPDAEDAETIALLTGKPAFAIGE